MESGPRFAFWRVQIIGWAMAGVVYFLAVLPRMNTSPLMLAGFKLVWAATGICVSSALAGVYRASRLVDRGLGPASTGAILLSGIVAILWVQGLGRVAGWLSGTSDLIFTQSSFPFVALNHLFILLAWSGGYLAIAYWQRAQLQEKKSLAATALAREAQLAMLRYQLNPHFLFNAMTSVRALILEHPERARETISRLSDFLRYTLSNRTNARVTVAEEFQIVRDYLAIEQVRFEEKLDTGVTLEGSAADEMIPMFLVHTLVENAVKHGTPLNGRLGVRIRGEVRDGLLRLEVANTGWLHPNSEPEEGVGLRNVAARMDVSFPGKYSVSLFQEGDWVRAVVTIELERNNDGSRA